MSRLSPLKSAGLLGLAMLTLPGLLWADQVEMVNGDRYQGKIISMTSNEVVMNSDMLGLVKIPRGKVAGMLAGTNSPVSIAVPAAPAQTRIVAPSSATNAAAPAIDLGELKTNATLMQQVKSKYLADAGPEATAKYNEMLKDLLTGKMSIGDLRNQAKSAADQLRGYKKELGSEAGSELDDYLAILDKFVKESDDSAAPAPAPKKTLPLQQKQ